ncbi:DUF503 domain-containing protein [Chryseomicrobium sp. FSL W7-1435]|uniref:DUF503 domain-containing protein n=1 Tax=Chryseomicrobium sp. FSL W7-1435 TaxID=2921704 RepID=UPI00315AB128
MILYLECEFILPQMHSLKEKRAVLQRMLKRTSQKYNVAVSELDFQDLWQRTKIGIVTVSSDRRHSERELHSVLEFLESNSEWECLSFTIHEL